jgi:nitrate/nitrite-specific signal transduction histidine kinase
MKRSIIRRLIIIGIGFGLFIGVTLALSIMINQRGISDGYVINIAGRERMLSQKMSKEIFIINAQDKGNYTELDTAMNEFQDGLDALRYGNVHYPSPTKDPEIVQQLMRINSVWNEFRKNITLFETSMMTLNSNKVFLDRHNKQMLTLSDNIVKAMVKDGLSGQDVDDSGRQRMLTQRMAYHLMRYTNKWDAQSYADFDESYKLYNETILRFYTDPKYKKYPRVYAEIDKAYKFWTEYSRHAMNVLANQQTVVDALNIIVTQNLKLLGEIEKVVRMYEVVSTDTRTALFRYQIVAVFILLLLSGYAIFVLLQIRKMFNSFIAMSQELALMHGNPSPEQLGEFMSIGGENELGVISRNISQFVRNMGVIEHDSNRAIELSENITQDITRITTDVIQSLERLDVSDEEKQKIVSEISLSEDIAIQTSEELIATSKLLNRLKKSLDVIAKYYDMLEEEGKHKKKS